MSNSLLHLLVLFLAFACFASFLWSIFGFFRREGPMPPRMSLISVSGAACMSAHMGGLMLVPSTNIVKELAAALLYASSLAIFWWALRTAWKTRLAIAFSNAPSGELLQTGPYRFIRHPIYAAYMLAWSAGAVAITGWWAWLPLGLMGTQYWLAILFEERQFLAGVLMREYRDYRRKTGMFLPNPLKLFVEAVLKST